MSSFASKDYISVQNTSSLYEVYVFQPNFNIWISPKDELFKNKYLKKQKTLNVVLKNLDVKTGVYFYNDTSYDFSDYKATVYLTDCVVHGKHVDNLLLGVYSLYNRKIL